MDDSAIMRDEVIDAETKSIKEETETVQTNFNEKKQPVTCKILIAFLLISISLLIAVSIYCYLRKYWTKQKHWLPFHVLNNEVKEIIYQKYKSKMSNKVKDIDIKKRAYYFFNDMINIKDFDIQIILN